MRLGWKLEVEASIKGMKASRSCFVKISLLSKQKDIVFQST